MLARTSTQWTTADSPAASATPMSTIRPVAPPRPPAWLRMRAAASTAPVSAATVTGVPRTPRTTTAMTAPALAPSVMPRTSGLASGLRSITWNAQPAAPNAAPGEDGHERARQGRLHQDERRPRDLLAADDADRVGEADPVVAEQRAHDHQAGEEQQEHADDDGPAAARPAAGPGQRVDGRGRAVATRVGGGSGPDEGHRHHSPRTRRTTATSTGAPMTAQTMPACTSDGRATSRPTTSARTTNAAPRSSGQDEQPAVVDPDGGAHDVRDDEPDEGDGAGQGGGAGGEEDGAAGGEAAVEHDVLPEPAGQVVAERDGVERRAGGEREQRADDEERQHLDDRRRLATRDGADLPEAEAVEGAPVGDEHARR